MASDVEVDITDIAIISALNTPGGAIHGWRNETAIAITAQAIATAPVNDPLNATHRGGVVGTYKRSFGWDSVGSNGHRVRATIFNGAGHADIVEFGRRESGGYERFAWRGWVPPGSIDATTRGTSARPGRHILRNAVNGVMPSATGGAYAPLA
jgi:hypothetical protein